MEQHLGQREFDTLFNKAIEEAYVGLSSEAKAVIDKYAQRLTGIKGLGEPSAREVLAKCGIFLLGYRVPRYSDFVKPDLPSQG